MELQLGASIFGPILGVLLGGVGWIAGRRKVRAETLEAHAAAFAKGAAGENTYAKMASSAWNTTQNLQGQLTKMDRRWRAAQPILEACADGDPALAVAIDELREMNGR